MGWSAKHGLRPNRPRRVTVYEDGKAVRRFPTPREPGYRVVGMMTEVATGVGRLLVEEKLRWRRYVWSQDWRLHPTKGWRVESPIRKSVETSPNSRQPEGWKRGIHEHYTFKRDAA